MFDEPDLLAVARISRALDGIPLALELAAARVASMSPVEIADRLADRFALLTSGARTAEARQRTLRATVDWSYALLTEQEQQVFNRLSVFHGGWTLSAAEAVVGDDSLRAAEVLDIIGRLIERSMITVERGRHHPLPDARDTAPVRRQSSWLPPTSRRRSRTGTHGTSETSPSPPSRRCAAPGSETPSGGCGRSNPTSAPHWPG